VAHAGHRALAKESRNWDLQDLKVFDGLNGVASSGDWLIGADFQDIQD